MESYHIFHETLLHHSRDVFNLTGFCRFFGKPSKSTLSVAECVAARHQKNGLAMFINKRAEIINQLLIIVILSTKCSQFSPNLFRLFIPFTIVLASLSKPVLSLLDKYIKEIKEFTGTFSGFIKDHKN